MILALWATILIPFQLIGMNHLIAVGALQPTAQAILLGGLNLDFWLAT